MKMLKTLLVLLVSVLMVSAADQSVTRILGDFKIGGETVTFSITSRPGEAKTVGLHITDQFNINKVTIIGTPAQLKELQAKLAKVIAEASK